MDQVGTLFQKLPKAELHVHIEGTLEPDMYLHFAERNKIKVPYTNQDQVRTALYKFHDLASFIDAYKKASEVICTGQDFYDLTVAYLKKADAQGVLHTEIFFDLQFDVKQTLDTAKVINGMHQAIVDCNREFGITGSLILCFVRDMSEESALKALELSLPFKDKIVAVGLASIEKNNPPSKFERVFNMARSHGLHTVAHAGEECGPDYVWQAIDILKAERIDHGVRCMEDPRLVAELVKRNIPLTVCPLSNVALGVYKNMVSHPIKKMFDAGLMVTINSDDPGFFGGYIGDNFTAVAKSLGFSTADLITIARNSLSASFASEERKKECLVKLNEYVKKHVQ